MVDVVDKDTGEVRSVPLAMPAEVAKAIIAVKKGVKALGDDSNNQHGAYKYVSVDKFYERIGRLMADAGLAVLIDEISAVLRENEKSKNPWLFCEYAVSFMHEAGAMSHPMRRSIALPISGPQAFGAAQSYIEKQFLRQVFKVPTGDKDADDTAPSNDAPASAPRGTQAARAAAPAQAAPKAEPASSAQPTASGDEEVDKTIFMRLRKEIMDAPDAAGLEAVMKGAPDDWARMEKRPEAYKKLIAFSVKAAERIREAEKAFDPEDA